MISGALILALIFYSGEYAFKYVQFWGEYAHRPSLKELRQFKPKDKVSRRNIRAVRIGAIFFFCFHLLYLLFLASVEQQQVDIQSTIATLKESILLILYINFMCRYVIYNEAGFKPPETANSYYPIYDIFKRTGWLVSGKDWVVRVINISTIFGLLLFLYVIYFSWGMGK